MVVISELKWENKEKYEKSENVSNENHGRTRKQLLINEIELSLGWINFFFLYLQTTNVRIAVETKNHNSLSRNMIEYEKTR